MNTKSIKGQRPFATPYALLTATDRFERYVWNRPSVHTTNPLPLMHTGNASKGLEFIAPEDLIVSSPYPLPYAVLHPFLKNFRLEDQRLLLKNISVQISGADYRPKGVAELLFEFSGKSQPGLGAGKSDTTACLDGLIALDGKLQAKVGWGRYEESYLTMNSQGIVLNPDNLGDHPHHAKLAEYVSLRFGRAVSVQEIVMRECNGLPDFGSGFARYILGVAGIITTTDGMFALVVRGKGTSVYRGSVNVTVSGGANFDREAILVQGLYGFLVQTLCREAKEELGIDVEPSSVDLLGAGREITRAGSPEFLFRINYGGTMTELLEAAASNQHPDASEVEGLHFFALRDLGGIVSSPDIAEQKRIHHKALLALHLMAL